MDIASMLEVEVSEMIDGKDKDGSKSKLSKIFSCQKYSKDEEEFYSLTYGSDVALVRFRRIHCTCCNEHIGSAPSDAHNMHEHPVLRVLLCAKCRDFYGDGTFEQGEDDTDMYCRWCANGGNLYCCATCSNTFCSNCIQRNFDPATIKKIEADEDWKCFVCDPRDLYPLRGMARALLNHIVKVTRILEKDSSLNIKEKEERMHADETSCCSRKRKRRRKRTMSISDDEDEDCSYIPEKERTDTPPLKKRKGRSTAGKNSYGNGYLDHEYLSNSKPTAAKIETEIDPTDLMMCEQTMIEGDTEIINPNGEEDSSESSTPKKQNLIKSSQQPMKFIKIQPKGNNNRAINPVPLANLLKVAISTGIKKIKVSQTANKNLVALPMTIIPKSVASTSIKFVKPSTHFLVPRPAVKNIQPSKITVQRQKPQSQPSVIDLESDDEPSVLDCSENNNGDNEVKSVAENNKISEDLKEANVGVIIKQPIESAQQINNGDDELVVLEETTESGKSPRTPTVDGFIPLKTQQRDQRFKKMLVLQSQEIDNTLGELKTKVLKLVQMSSNRSNQDEDLLNAAGLCTKRFHRAMRKAMVELSQINDRLVRDYVHWKKRSVQQPTTKKKRKQSKDDLSVEMICVRDSASESELDNDDDDDDFDSIVNDRNRILEASDIPSDYSTILDHLTLFKRKLTSVKAVGDTSVVTEDKACQADDVPWRDYEKCIGYSLLTRADYDPETKEEVLRPIVTHDENFGKYQEQFLFYLQHIEDHGIETDEMKGLPEPHDIPLKDMIDGTSPFITDMIDRLSPETLENGCSRSPNRDDSKKNSEVTSAPASKVDASSPPVESIPITNSRDQKFEIAAPTSKAVQELEKMVTKLSEKLRTKQTGIKETEEDIVKAVENETQAAVNSIVEIRDEQRAGDEITISEDDYTTLD